MRVLDNRLTLTMVAVAALVAVSGALSVLNTGLLHDTLGKVAHTHEVLATLESALAVAISAETEQRGYLITDDPAYLELYRTMRVDADARLTRLAELVKDNPLQGQRTIDLRRALRERFAVLDEGVTAIQEKGFDLAKQVVLSSRGHDSMDAARATVGVMRAEEERLLAERTTAAGHARLVAIGSALASALLALLALAGFARQLRHRMRERLLAANGLHVEKERFRTTLASIGDGVITTDTEARVTFLNSVAEELTGWPLGEATGQPLQRVFHIENEDTGELVENPAVRALRDGGIVGLANHTVLRTRAGDGHPIDDSAAPIRAADGSIFGAVLVFRDVAARRQADRELREADVRKDRFLALLAHELRNPLAPLRHSLEIMQLTSDPVQVAELRGVMERQLAQMVRLVDDLLDVSRITSNKHEMRFETVELSRVVAAALETFRPVLEAARQELQTSLPATPHFVRADPVRLAQVLGNLLNNASKFSDPGATIRLAAEREGDELVLRVSDHGLGIPPAMLERIFEMFLQVDESLERSRSGLGVGLTLVRRIVELHGGRVEACSDGPGKGSTFVVRLPVAAAPASAAPAAAAPAAAAPAAPPPPAQPRAAPVAARRILVADDNLDSAESLARLLQLRGHELRIAHDGRQALREVQEFRPQIVLLDIGMPKLNGYDAARAIRSQPGGDEPLLIAVTGWGSADDLRRTREAGFDFHLVKPLHFATLESLFTQPRRPRS